MSDTTTTTKFPLGLLVMTAGVSAWSREDLLRPLFIATSVARHQSGDWGDVDDEDKGTNDHALAHGYRLLSAYTSIYTASFGTKIWIITEADRSSTTVLFPSEY